MSARPMRRLCQDTNPPRGLELHPPSFVDPEVSAVFEASDPVGQVPGFSWPLFGADELPVSGDEPASRVSDPGSFPPTSMGMVSSWLVASLF